MLVLDKKLLQGGLFLNVIFLCGNESTDMEKCGFYSIISSAAHSAFWQNWKGKELGKRETWSQKYIWPKNNIIRDKLNPIPREAQMSDWVSNCTLFMMRTTMMPTMRMRNDCSPLLWEPAANVPPRFIIAFNSHLGDEMRMICMMVIMMIVIEMVLTTMMMMAMTSFFLS